MAKQRLDEWLKISNKEYFDKQFANPYRSTVLFCDWLEKHGILTSVSKQKIIDIGTGKGANIYYLNQRFPKCTYLGLDINPLLIKEGNKFFEKQNINNCILKIGDLYNLDQDVLNEGYDGLLSFQTLSWLPEYERALDEFIKINPEWMAFTSLFYDGFVDCKIEVKEYFDSGNFEHPKVSFYNIYSLPKIKDFLSRRNYSQFYYYKFNIDIDLPKPTHGFMQTYTQTLINEERLQISGPILMSWFFILAKK